MRPSISLLVATFALLASGCAQNAATHRVDSTEALDCLPFIDAGTALAAELAAHPDRTNCETRYGPQGGYVESFGSTSLSPRGATSDLKGMIMVYRYFGWDEGLKPIEASDLSWDKDFRVVTRDLPVQLTGVVGTGRVVRFESVDSDVTRVCVSANTKNANGSRTLVDLCRPIGRLASDDAVLAEAKLIANEDFPAINP